jgi:hypothetical protein
MAMSTALNSGLKLPNPTHLFTCYLNLQPHLEWVARTSAYPLEYSRYSRYALQWLLNVVVAPLLGTWQAPGKDRHSNAGLADSTRYVSPTKRDLTPPAAGYHQTKKKIG